MHGIRGGLSRASSRLSGLVGKKRSGSYNVTVLDKGKRSASLSALKNAAKAAFSQFSRSAGAPPPYDDHLYDVPPPEDDKGAPPSYHSSRSSSLASLVEEQKPKLKERVKARYDAGVDMHKHATWEKGADKVVSLVNKSISKHANIQILEGKRNRARGQEKALLNEKIKVAQNKEEKLLARAEALESKIGLSEEELNPEDKLRTGKQLTTKAGRVASGVKNIILGRYTDAEKRVAHFEKEGKKRSERREAHIRQTEKDIKLKKFKAMAKTR